MTYKVISETLLSEILGSYETFGTAVFDSSNNQVMKISDISTDCDKVLDIAKKCNDGNLDEIHLLNVIEDSFV